MFRKEPYTSKEKSHLLSSIKRGGSDGRKALTTIYTNYNYQNYLRLYNRERGISPDEAQDFVSEAIITFRKQVRKGMVDTSTNIDTYITSIAKNKIQNARRSMKSVDLTDEILDSLTVEESPATYYASQELKDKLNEVFDHLNPKCKRLLNLWKQDYSYDEIAVELDFGNRDLARKQKFRCFKKLMEIVPSYPELKSFYNE